MTATTRNPLVRLLESKSTVIIDGALATELEARGCDLNDSLWSAKVLIEQPGLIQEVHTDYFKAGADIVITASYQATPSCFQRYGIAPEEACALIKRSVMLAKQARDDILRVEPHRTLLIAGSVGPYGAYLADGSEYRGDYRLSEDEFKAFHKPRMQALIEGGVDLLACETLPSFMEVKALLSLLEEFPSITAWFSCTLRDDSHISDGTPVAEVAEALNTSPQVVAMGVNCIPEGQVTAAMKHFATLTTKPLLAYPNSGEQWDAVNKKWYGQHTRGSGRAERVAEWISAGARLVGGCCRTTPEDIRTIRASC